MPVVAPGVKGATGAYCPEHAAAAIRVLVAEGTRAEPEPVQEPATKARKAEPRPKPAPKPKAPPKPERPPKVWPRPVMASIDAHAVLALRAEGATLPQIAARLGVGRSSICRALREAGMIRTREQEAGATAHA